VESVASLFFLIHLPSFNCSAWKLSSCGVAFILLRCKKGENKRDVRVANLLPFEPSVPKDISYFFGKMQAQALCACLEFDFLHIFFCYRRSSSEKTKNPAGKRA
jgi:hypothetical protein